MSKYDFFYVNTQGTITLGRPIQVGPAFLNSGSIDDAREMHRMLKAAPLMQSALAGLLNCLDDNTEDTAARVAAAEHALSVARGEDTQPCPRCGDSVGHAGNMPGECPVHEQAILFAKYESLRDLVSDMIEDPDSKARVFFGEKYDEVVDLLVSMGD